MSGGAIGTDDESNDELVVGFIVFGVIPIPPPPPEMVLDCTELDLPSPPVPPLVEDTIIEIELSSIDWVVVVFVNIMLEDEISMSVVVVIEDAVAA